MSDDPQPIDPEHKLIELDFERVRNDLPSEVHVVRITAKGTIKALEALRLECERRVAVDDTPPPAEGIPLPPRG